MCTPGVCPGNPGPLVSTSPNLVTSVTQCNGSANDAAPTLVTCRVNIINNVSAKTPGVNPVTAATVNECVGTGGGGGDYDGRGPLLCDPSNASTTGATVTQCNGSVTGGGSTAVCSVASASKVSTAIPVTVSQCNGTGNKGGTLLTCSVSITTNITAEKTTGSPSDDSGNGGNGGDSGDTNGTKPQVSRLPTGSAGAGGGSTAGLNQTGLLTLGGGLLLGAGMNTLFGRRVSRRD